MRLQYGNPVTQCRYLKRIMPALKYAGNEQLTNEVLNEKDVAAIIQKMATYSAW